MSMKSLATKKTPGAATRVRTSSAARPPVGGRATGRPGAATPQPRAARLQKEADICAEAERQFAQYGFEGCSLEEIAAALGLSRHNLLY